MVPDKLQDSFFRALFHAPIHGIAVADLASQCVILTNQRMLDIVGLGREEVEGVPFKWREITPPEYYPLDEAALRQVAERGYSDPIEKEYVKPDGTRVPVRLSFSLVEDHPERMIVFVDDITGERLSHARERAAQQRLEIAVSAARQGVWDWDLRTNEMIYSPRAKEIYGFSQEGPLTFEQVRDATHPDDLPITLGLLDRALDPKIRDRSSYEYRIVHPDGSICWAMAFGEAVFEGPPGAEKAVRYVGTLQDITERKTAERHQQLLVKELNHRVKNTLAIVQALAYQSLREVPEEISEAFSGRLQALSAAHDVLTASAWEEAEVGELARAVLESYDPANDRITLDGPAVAIAPKVAVSLALILHELATNARDHGALAGPAGRVTLSWSLPATPEAGLSLCWKESGGRPVAEPELEGFGLRFIKRSVAGDLGGAVALAFAPDGAECRIQLPPAKAPNGGRPARAEPLPTIQVESKAN